MYTLRAKKVAGSIALLLLVLLSIIAPLPANAAAIYLPTVGTGPQPLPDHLLGPIPIDPPDAPPPILRLQDGIYEYKDSMKWVYFRISNYGQTADLGVFTLKSNDPYQLYCSDAGAVFSGSVEIGDDTKFQMSNVARSGLTVYAAMKCEVISTTQASCTISDYFALMSGFADNCGLGSATVTLRQN